MGNLILKHKVVDNTSRKMIDPSSSIENIPKALIILLTVFGAEASATEATAMSSSETFRSTNGTTVGVTHTWSLETVALRLTSSCFCHHCWPHLCNTTHVNKTTMFMYVPKTFQTNT